MADLLNFFLLIKDYNTFPNSGKFGGIANLVGKIIIFFNCIAFSNYGELGKICNLVDYILLSLKIVYITLYNSYTGIPIYFLYHLTQM